MFVSYQDAESFLLGIVLQTRDRSIVWQENHNGGFVERGFEHASSFCLFFQFPQASFICRAPSEAFDLVIAQPTHERSLQLLFQSIKRQLGLLF